MDDRTSRNGSASQELLRMLPSVNELLLAAEIQPLLATHPRIAVVNATRRALETMRAETQQGLHSSSSLSQRVESIPQAVADELASSTKFSLRPVLNATGVILHTNLGRAPLSKFALDHLSRIAIGYSNLEFDIATGERGSRDVHVESLVLELLSRQAGLANLSATHRAIVVNNCAAATFLALHALAGGKEVVVSRGELVEIGGGFRIPDILRESGATMREVGTTNRTRLSDYEEAISAKTGLILRVHPSNFTMEGFVERPAAAQLVELGRRAGIPVLEDQGTGLVQPLEPLGISGEPTLAASLQAGCDIVAASGDKLLGGPQCGLLIGTAGLIGRIRKNPVFRALRVDKLTYAALEATLAQHLSNSPASIPVVRMLELSADEIRRRCETVAHRLAPAPVAAEVVAAESLIGGGTTPKATLPSFTIALRAANLSASEMLLALRRADPPIIGRVSDDLVLLDLRTIDPEFDALLPALICQALGAEIPPEDFSG